MEGNAHQHWVIPFLKEWNGPVYECCRSICLDGMNPLPDVVFWTAHDLTFICFQQGCVQSQEVSHLPPEPGTMDPTTQVPRWPTAAMVEVEEASPVRVMAPGPQNQPVQVSYMLAASCCLVVLFGGLNVWEDPLGSFLSEANGSKLKNSALLEFLNWVFSWIGYFRINNSKWWVTNSCCSWFSKGHRKRFGFGQMWFMWYHL